MAECDNQGERALPDLIRNALRNDEVLAAVTAAVLPFVASRHTLRYQPGEMGPPEGNPTGEWTSTNGELATGQRTQRPLPDPERDTAVSDVVDVERFYRDVLWELGEHAQKGGSAFGAAAVVKRVAKGYGLAVADHVPLPRPSRAERERIAWERREARR